MWDLGLCSPAGLFVISGLAWTKRTGCCGKRTRGKGPCRDSCLVFVSGLYPHDVGQGCLVTARQSPSASQRLNIQMEHKQGYAGYMESTHHHALLWPQFPLRRINGSMEIRNGNLRSHRPADSIDDVDAWIILAAPAHAARPGCRYRVARVPQGLKGRQNSDV